MGDGIRLVIFDLDGTLVEEGAPTEPRGRLPVHVPPRLAPGVVEALQVLSPGRALVLVCPGPVAETSARLAELGLDRAFDEVRSIESDQAPDRAWAFSQVALERRVPPSRAVVVGDRLDQEIAAGRALGMWTVRVLSEGSRHQASRGDLDRPDFSLESLEALPMVIEEIEAELADEAPEARGQPEC